MKRKEGFTFDEHREAGRQLRKARDCAMLFATLICSRYGKTHRAYALATRAVSVIDSLRSELDDCVFREFPSKDNSLKCSLYYGKAPDNNDNILCPHYDVPTAHYDENKK